MDYSQRFKVRNKVKVYNPLKLSGGEQGVIAIPLGAILTVTGYSKDYDQNRVGYILAGTHPRTGQPFKFPLSFPHANQHLMLVR